MYAQSKRLTQPVLPPNSSSSSTPISCEVVGANGCKWSKDVHDVSNSHSQICAVIRTSREMYGEMMERSSISCDQESANESTTPSSPPSITPCSEATSLAILSVNDDGNERMNTTMEEEDEDITTRTTMTTTTPIVNTSHHDNTMEEEDDVEVDDDVLARECALLVEGGDADTDDVYMPEECSITTTTITDGSNSNGNDNDNDNDNAITSQYGLHDSSENNITLTTSMSMGEDQPIHSSPNIALPSLSTSTNPSPLPSNPIDNDNINDVDNTPSTTSTSMNDTNPSSSSPTTVRSTRSSLRIKERKRVDYAQLNGGIYGKSNTRHSSSSSSVSTSKQAKKRKVMNATQSSDTSSESTSIGEQYITDELIADEMDCPMPFCKGLLNALQAIFFYQAIWPSHIFTAYSHSDIEEEITKAKRSCRSKADYANELQSICGKSKVYKVIDEMLLNDVCGPLSYVYLKHLRMY